MACGLGGDQLSLIFLNEVQDHPTYQPLIAAVFMIVDWTPVDLACFSPAAPGLVKVDLLFASQLREQAQRCDHELCVLESVFPRLQLQESLTTPAVSAGLSAPPVAAFKASLVTTFTGWQKCRAEHKQWKENCDYQPLISDPNWNGISWRSQKQQCQGTSLAYFQKFLQKMKKIRFLK